MNHENQPSATPPDSVNDSTGAESPAASKEKAASPIFYMSLRAEDGSVAWEGSTDADRIYKIVAHCIGCAKANLP